MEMRMMVYSLIVNIAVLVIIANILSHVPAFQRSIQREHRSLREDFNLSIVFFAIIVVSTLMEIKTTSYSLNTRMIGTMAAGLLGGAGDRIFRIHAGRHFRLFLHLPGIPGSFHGFLYGVLRSSGGRILSVLPARTLEIQGYGAAGRFCGGV